MPGPGACAKMEAREEARQALTSGCDVALSSTDHNSEKQPQRKRLNAFDHACLVLLNISSIDLLRKLPASLRPLLPPAATSRAVTSALAENPRSRRSCPRRNPFVACY
ncbi:hypothetical protein C0Q70_00150 [Pomacea canaliculata]|uniref:Uncharacterized protein n=1 Tax=Pomacea canaliculata TaxID=400727 RepID=A0A2T7PVU8_POMCA|nr:hypothetical protein C0Q70_00150 [Pomacea canaliculata]